jgi:hypothetical protein
MIILGLAFLGGVALKRQQVATDSPAVGSPGQDGTAAPEPATGVAAPAVVEPATPSSPRATQAAGGGILRITTVPSGAQVELDGVTVGVTSLTLRGVAPGRRTVRVSRNGFKVERRDLEVVDGETTVLTLTLSATPTPAAPRRRGPSGPPLPPPPLPPAPP